MQSWKLRFPWRDSGSWSFPHWVSKLELGNQRNFRYISYQQIDLSVDVVSVRAEDYNIAVDQPLTVEAL